MVRYVYGVRRNPFSKAIEGLCYTEAGPNRYHVPTAAAVADIEAARHRYVVQTRFGEVPLLVISMANGSKALRTKANGELPDNLSELPDC